MFSNERSVILLAAMYARVCVCMSDCVRVYVKKSEMNFIPVKSFYSMWKQLRSLFRKIFTVFDFV